MTISGKQLIGGEWISGDAGKFYGVDPTTGSQLQPAISSASPQQVERALTLAKDAAEIFRKTTPAKRAAFLRDCAEQILALGDELLERVAQETGYPKARAEMERGRTCGQLRLFANYIEAGDYLDARIDTAMPERQPAPRPDIRHVNQAIGPVVVFGASNFPLAFSVAGGDTASALAAGCPVIVKAHPSHPGTSELVAQALAQAVARANFPGGVFSLLQDENHAVGSQLVKAAEIKAVGFTGSLAGGTALMKLANERADPIPVFAEMGSVNPVFLLPGALAENAGGIARAYVTSFTLGSGQFCVKPGLVIAIDDEGLKAFIAASRETVEKSPAAVMLNGRICSAFGTSVAHYHSYSGLQFEASGGNNQGRDGYYSQVTLMSTTAKYLLENPQLIEETFGPASIIVKCRNEQELLRVAAALPGQLTATVHCAETELVNYTELMDRLTEMAGRVVVNGFPTGVEVCHAMVHGGPFPATSDKRFTSVGTNAIQRFVRPVCYQNYPEALLPPALQNHNPLGITRLVDGVKNTNSLVPSGNA